MGLTPVLTAGGRGGFFDGDSIRGTSMPGGVLRDWTVLIPNTGARFHNVGRVADVSSTERELVSSVDLSPAERRAAATAALAGFDGQLSTYRRLEVRCRRSHHVAAVYSIDENLVYRAVVGA